MRYYLFLIREISGTNNVEVSFRSAGKVTINYQRGSRRYSERITYESEFPDSRADDNVMHYTRPRIDILALCGKRFEGCSRVGLLR